MLQRQNRPGPIARFSRFVSLTGRAGITGHFGLADLTGWMSLTGRAGRIACTGNPITHGLHLLVEAARIT
jgi:hypothetical protein